MWLKIAKAAGRRATVTKPQAIVTAISHGWIDGQLSALDAEVFPCAIYAAKTREQVVSNQRGDGGTPLEGEPRHAGRVTRDRSGKKRRALRASPKTKREFDALGRANRFAIIYRVQDAKKAQTRAKRIATYIAMLEDGRTLHPKRARRPPR